MAEQELPKQIQAQIDQAEEIERQIAAATAPEGNTESQTINTQPTSQEPVIETAQAQSQDEESFKRRYEILQTKYNAEVPRLHEEVRNNKHTLKHLEEELNALKARPTEIDKPREALVTSKDEETFGTDLIDLSRRVVKDEVSEVLARIKDLEQAIAQVSKLPEKINQIENMQVQSAEEKFWGDVASKVPNWQVVDSDPTWIEFLGTTPKFSRRTYKDLAIDAIAQGDVDSIVGLVDIWKEVTGQTQQEINQSNKQKELQSQVSPGKAKSSAPAPADKGRVWTGAEYEAAFDQRLGKTMSEAEIDKLQLDAETALVEGRVRW